MILKWVTSVKFDIKVGYLCVKVISNLFLWETE